MSGAPIAVIGAGPAGAAAAWTLALAGRDVILIERGTYPRDKVCGEYISAEALPLLRAMVPDLVAAAPRIHRAVFVAPGGRPHGFDLPEPAVGISRLALDAALWTAAGAAGAALRPHTTVTDVEPVPGGFTLRLGGGEGLAASAVILAAGRQCRLPGFTAPDRGPQEPRSGPHVWLGVKARVSGIEPAPAIEMFGFPGGYCGLAPVENAWTNACCLIRRDRAGELKATHDFISWIIATARHPGLRDRLLGAIQVTPTVVTAPVDHGPRAALLNRALAAGDTSGFIDPFTGDGIARALLSGALAAEYVDEPAAYAAALARAARPALRVGARLRLLVNAPVWMQRAAVPALAGPIVGPRLLAATRWRRL